MKTLFLRQRGISLIEALVALVVISVGALAIAKLHGNLVSSSGLSKARSEAVQIAQGNNERLRNLIEEDQYTGLQPSGSQSDIQGINATFDLTWTTSDVTANFDNAAGVSVPYGYKRIVSTVTWTDTKGEVQTVVQSTQIAWSDPRRSVAATSEGGGVGRHISPPTGRARMADGTEQPIDREGEGVTAIDHSDGLTTLIEGKKVQLVKGDQVIMTMETSTEGQGFSTISGKVFMDSDFTFGVGNNQVDQSKVRVISSDASLCTRTFANGSDFGETPLTEFTLFEVGPYRYYEYTCYFGEGWYGNISIVRLDNAANSDRVCVGDPTQELSNAWDSRHPALSAIRRYRGYIEREGGGYTPVGIGLNPTVPGYDAAEYINHHFLLTPINGNPEDEDCDTAMTEESNVLFSANENPGENVCITVDAEGQTTCPGEETPDEMITFISGRIAKNGDEASHQPVLSSLQISAGTCSFLDQGSYYDYSCETLRSGWTGETWSDELTLGVDEENKLCSTKGGTAESYATIDVTNFQAIFRGVPIALTDATLNLEIGYTSAQCPRTTTIIGEIYSHAPGNQTGPAVTAIQMVSANFGSEDVVCTVNASGSTYFYECVIDWTGITAGTSWSANMNLTLTSGVICSSSLTSFTGTVPEVSEILPQRNLDIATAQNKCP